MGLFKRAAAEPEPVVIPEDPQVVKIRNAKHRQAEMLSQILKNLLVSTKNDKLEWTLHSKDAKNSYTAGIVVGGGCGCCSVSIVEDGSYFRVHVSDTRGYNLLSGSFFPSIHSNPVESAGYQAVVLLLQAIKQQPDRLEASFNQILEGINRLSQGSEEFSDDGASERSNPDSV